MKLVVLTTDTPHHTYYVRELLNYYPDLHVMIESQGVKAGFPISHPFEQQRDNYEYDVCFDGQRLTLSDIVECTEYTNINEPNALSKLASLNPDAVVVFGTGIIKPALIELVKDKIINLHGGDPEYYRGLDSHLWAIYHKEFDQLVTTIHQVNPVLDDGHIIMKLDIPLFKGMELFQLRKSNTDVCIKLTRYALTLYELEGSFPAVKQKQTGKYYSFMPDVMKELCIKKFENFTRELA